MIRTRWIIGGGVVLIMGSLASLWFLSAAPPTTSSTRHTHRPHHTSHTTVPRASKPRLTTSTHSQTTTASNLGHVAWARQWRAVLSKQWHHAAPPLWIAPDPRRAHTWFAVAPMAYHGALWWGYATPRHPLPRFSSVSTTLHLSNAQIAALPPPFQATLKQTWDLLHQQPWNLTTAIGPLSTNTQMTWQQAENNGKVADPIGWSLTWDPAIPKQSGSPAVPAAVNVAVNMPWTPTGQSTIVISNSFQWMTTGKLVAGGTVGVYMTGPSQTITPQDVSVMEPTSTAAGISKP